MLIHKDAFKAALAAVDEKDQRGYFLNAVQVVPGEKDDRAVMATNGHILIIARDRAGETFADADFPAKGVPPYNGEIDKPILIDAGHVDRLIKAMPKKSPIPVLSCVQITKNGDGAPVASSTDLEVPCVVHLPADDSRRFPDHKWVMVGSDKPHLKVVLSTEVLKAILNAAAAAHGGRKTLNTIELQIPTDPSAQGRTWITSHEFEESPDHCSGKDCPCKVCGLIASEHKEPDGAIETQIRFEIKGQTIDVEGVLMPCKR